MRFVILVVLLVLLGFFASQRIFNPQLNHNSVLDRLQHPFDNRLRYKIGAIDPRFNISEEQLKTIIQQAADIWFLGTSKQYFSYDPNAQLTINLIYDQRQADSQARQLEMSRLDSSKSLTDIERQKLKQFESDLDFQHRQIELIKVNYQTKLDHYNQQVQRLNQTQSRSSAFRDQLQAQRQQIENEQLNVQHQIDTFNLNVSRVNQHVDAINSMNDQFNTSVADFNQHFQAKQFDKGIFNGREINIYQFQNQQDLKLTLAHELGHGLGLLHSEDPQSLMYPILEKQNFKNFVLTPADLELLNNRK